MEGLLFFDHNYHLYLSYHLYLVKHPNLVAPVTSQVNPKLPLRTGLRCVLLLHKQQPRGSVWIQSVTKVSIATICHGRNRKLAKFPQDFRNISLGIIRFPTRSSGDGWTWLSEVSPHKALCWPIMWAHIFGALLFNMNVAFLFIS